MSKATERRRRELLALLQVEGSLTMNAVAQRFGVSAMTARRDAEALVQEGGARRAHGRLLSADAMGTRPTRALTIGVMVPRSDYYFNAILAGAHDAAVAAGGKLVLGVSDYGATDEVRIVARLKASGADGLLIAPTPSGSDGRFSRTQQAWLSSLEIPTVILERGSSVAGSAARLDSVYSLHDVGIGLAVDHLAKQGHSHIGLVTFPNTNLATIAAGFRAAVIDASLATCQDIIASWDNLAKARGPVMTAIAAGVTGFAVYNDHVAAQLLEWIAEAGLDVPNDVSVVGYDDEIAQLCEPPLTSVAPYKHHIGFLAVNVLADRLNAGTHPWPGLRRPPGADASRAHIGIVPALVVRSSVAPPRRDR